MIRVLRTAAVFAVVFVLYLAFRVLGRPGQFSLGAEWVEGLLKVGVWVVPCLLVLRASLRVGYTRVFQELSLDSGIARGYLFGFLSTLPMLLVLSLDGVWKWDLGVVIGTVILGSFAEEVLFRGFLFGQLVRRAGWPLSTAMLVSALAFGLAHLGNVAVTDVKSLMRATGEVGMTAAGGALFAWIVWRSGSLWPAVGLHTFMNLWWELFGVQEWASRAPESGVGPSVPNLVRIASILVAVVLIRRWKRP